MTSIASRIQSDLACYAMSASITGMVATPDARLVVLDRLDHPGHRRPDSDMRQVVVGLLLQRQLRAKVAGAKTSP